MKNKVNFLGAIAWCEQHNLSFAKEYKYMETAFEQCLSVSEAKPTEREKISWSQMAPECKVQ